MAGAYYNEIDPYAAEWLRNLIKAGHIAAGDVDERSIEDVRPDDLRGYAQCHFFAGLGAWSRALRLAGWPDDRPVWTGSCPCQPFSAAGQGAGFADERHLWPAFHHLIRFRKPSVILGEQVASKDANPWIDLVQDDLEAVGYRVGAVPFPSAGVGAPHIRDRLYWVADSDGNGCSPRRKGRAPVGHRAPAESDRSIIRLDDTDNERLEGFGSGHQATRRQRQRQIRPAAAPGESGGLADTESTGRAKRSTFSEGSGERGAPEGMEQRSRDGGVFASEWPGPTNGFWRDADWLGCRDGKWRPVEPGTFPLADGIAGRVGRLRAYGNAINAEAAAEFIRAYLK